MRRALQCGYQPGPRPRMLGLIGVFLAAGAETWAQGHASAGARSAGNVARQVQRRIVISLADRKLVLTEDGRAVKVYEVAVGAAATPSPVGAYVVANRIVAPTYYAPGNVIGPGPDNPLGTRWIGLSLRGFGIHGTNEPRSIGRRASHGCIRMHQRDVEELFERVRVGDAVELHAARTPEVETLLRAAELPSPGPQPAPAPSVALLATRVMP